ncbi:serine/threonine-protein kinase [Mesomycoplasma neurolyticum]|uniref:Serine/threonine protein kinase n=1 Tax=Mesomycoplasma neurolyticum TaxID=2120 RepID=A0A449A5U1_9BACT|nr:serine/threonine-protein kinase [Mesomycoplasma neurolyticum]VEU59523.1 serine/threonine protein kinase [Mesomycoplasma neurolyticum]
MNVHKAKKLNENYQVFNLIAQGGMASVYYAIRKKDNLPCAIKLIKPTIVDKNVSIKRFKEEIRIHEKVKSLYVAKIYDTCFDELNQEFWISMEFVEGVTLKNKIEESGSLNEEDTVEYAKQIALGLKAIHDVNANHRDIKDTNIMITNLNEIKIVDLGIAIDDKTKRVTGEQKVVGSPHYIPGEISTYKREKSSIKIDVYSLGITIYQMLLGRVPFDGENFIEILDKHRKAPVPRIKSLKPTTSNGLINVILKALAKNPKDRYNNMLEFYNDLDTCLDENRKNEQEISFKEEKPKKIVNLLESNKWFLILIISIAIIIIIIIVIIILLYIGGSK